MTEGPLANRTVGSNPTLSAITSSEQAKNGCQWLDTFLYTNNRLGEITVAALLWSMLR
jgi:hypothetical protein